MSYLYIQLHYISFCMYTHNITYGSIKASTMLWLWSFFYFLAVSKIKKKHTTFAHKCMYRALYGKKFRPNSLSLYFDIFETCSVIIHSTITVLRLCLYEFWRLKKVWLHKNCTRNTFNTSLLYNVKNSTLHTSEFVL